ncbi:lipopolysaccharide transport periplasmic protein LptA [Uliginosibacterium sp. 31-16]|uniref:lipopolysaccharide transport periplasmic protein LptA n=1 Tax=Uliginosibacterium sp. 31-16 TaxID=3068315 RepID=UPI00273F9757|nr:lipopolysaccharide transport periplasmic protein LptA [Uliginosibacterium sp. 31-16]MDP5241235.1 lipopolysaccharide transport periplasmic protein LptA [Uliginosibacterium sp. 31-16]
MSPAFRFSLFALLLIAPLAHAERADRSKPVTIESDRLSVDDRNKVQVFEGRVKLTQGTLEITSDKLVVTQDAEGFQKGVATGGKDGLARFRQKREGKNEYTEGEAERIEYEGRNDMAKLFTRAMTRSGLDETRGQYIEYNGYTEQYTVTNGPNASVSKNSNERVHTTIWPKGTAPETAVSRPAGK